MCLLWLVVESQVALEILARKAVQEGDIKHGSVMSGQIAGLVKEEISCRQLIDSLVQETDALLKGAGAYV